VTFRQKLSLKRGWYRNELSGNFMSLSSTEINPGLCGAGTAYSKSVSMTWRWGTVFPEEDELKSHAEPFLDKGNSLLLFYFHMRFYLFLFTFWNAWGKVLEITSCPPVSIQFPIFLLDALSHFSLFQSREVQLRSGWPILVHFILSKTVPLTPHQKKWPQKK